MTAEEKKQRHDWRIWFGCMAITNLVLFGAVTSFQLRFDPFGVWHISSTPGLNHRKSGQAGTERIFKVYQYQLKKPDVVFLGNSRGAWGLPAKWHNTPDEKVYNLAFDAQRLGDASRLLDFMLEKHRPKTLVLALDPIIMTNTAYGNQNLGGFDERMKVVTPTTIGLLGNKLKETVFSFDAIEKSLECRKNSKKFPGGEPFYINGWFTVKGRQLRPNAKQYRKSFWRYFSSLHKLVHPDKSSVRELYYIVDKARRSGIRVVVSFAPLLSDYLLSIDANGRIIGLNQMKRQIAAKIPFWDFAYVNSVTGNRFNYIDSTHYRGIVGEMMLARMSGGDTSVPADFGVLVSQKNINDHLYMTMEKLTVWKQQQQKLYTMLKKATQHKNESIFETELKKIVPMAR